MTDATGELDAERETFHWSGIAAVAFVVGGVGAIAANPGLVLASVVFVGFAGYAWIAEPVATHGDGGAVLAIDRHLDDPAPDPGDEVTVTVGVRNDGAGLCSDVRVVDGVPDGLAVVDGSPRHGAVLRPGARSTFSYTVTARRGEHEWDGTAVTLADPLGTTERTITVSRETRLHCTLPDDGHDATLRRAVTDWLPGVVETETGGSGLEFHSTREYRPSDPRTRIDWYRRARTGELGTIDFREERAATVMMVLDARREAYRSPGPAATHAVDRSVEAADRLFTALLDAGNQVGITALGRDDECWLEPAAGDAHRTHGRALLNTHPALSSQPPDRDHSRPPSAEARDRRLRGRIDRLHRRLPAETQLLVLSPCCDDEPATVARRLRDHGRAVTMISPDPTVATSVHTRLARFEREDRLDALRRKELTVIDWAAGEPLERTLAEAAGWSR